MSEAILLDTDVLSRLRRPDRHPELAAWFAATPGAAIRISSITVMEIQSGIEGQVKRNPDFARDLSLWRDQILGAYGARIVPFDANAALETGRLVHRLGYMSPDLQIAGIALAQDMAVATLNQRHFVPTGCRIIPF